MNVSNILSAIDLGSIALPEFQRGYVWNGDQVRGLMHSLYRRYPVGSLLVWVTRAETDQLRGGHSLTGPVRLLLDGQQRITSLYGIIRGKPPQFFEGNAQSFTNLYFHLGDEVFQFYAPLKMKDNPLWINVTELMQSGVAPFISRLLASSALDHSQINTYINRLTAIENIKQIELHVEEVAGEDKTIDVVVDIFNRVNSGGTMLSKGDLALAKIGADWPQARSEMNQRLEKWRNAGFSFRLEWFLRCINSVLTGNALFNALADVKASQFQEALNQTERFVDTLLGMISTRLGLDHDQVLGSRYSFPLLARYLAQRGGELPDSKERDQLLFWYVHTFLWGRYAGSTESVLNQDLTMIEVTDGALDRLIGQLRQNRGDLHIYPNDFSGWGRNNRFYPVIYMLTRTCHARDWVTGRDLSTGVPRQPLDLHRIFPRDALYAYRYSRPEVNAIANYAFVTPQTWPFIANRNPADYLEELASKHPGVLQSHWIPTDRSLWSIENYREFLKARQALMAETANAFLNGLREGTLPEPIPTPYQTVIEIAGKQPTSGRDDEEALIRMCNGWVMQQGLPAGETMYELVDSSTGQVLAYLDLAWPSGIQEGYSQPVALVLDEIKEVEAAAEGVGYRVFTSVAPFYRYVEREILALVDASTPEAA
jgi:hypothetical protein